MLRLAEEEKAARGALRVAVDEAAHPNSTPTLTLTLTLP